MTHNLATVPIELRPHARLPGLHRPANTCSWIRLLLISLLLPLGNLGAQEDAPVKSGLKTEADQATDSEVGQPAKPVMTPEKRAKVAIATMMMAGVVVTLLLLFLWMLWWSRRTRKLLREPLPAAGRGDELWYLKAKQDVQKATERLSGKKETPPPHPRPES